MMASLSHDIELRYQRRKENSRHQQQAHKSESRYWRSAGILHAAGLCSHFEEETAYTHLSEGENPDEPVLHDLGFA